MNDDCVLTKIKKTQVSEAKDNFSNIKSDLPIITVLTNRKCNEYNYKIESNTFPQYENNLHSHSESIPHVEKINTSTYPNGSKYTGFLNLGDMIGNSREGYGVQEWPDGAKYEGLWKNNKANGHGKFIHSNGDVYEGNWVDDKVNGQGVYNHANGTVYDGEWANDQKHGFGNIKME